jgi:hypothetical protein
MERNYRPPSILHLTGITLKDYVPIEDVADEKVLDSASCEDQCDEQYAGENKVNQRGVLDAAFPYDKIPKVFTSLEEWPLRTNLRCHEYDFTFDDRPKFIPTYIRVNEDSTYEIGVRGNFCTFNAAARHINATIHNAEERWRTQDMLKFVYSLFTGVTVSHIEPGPAKTDLVYYGGSWDEETLWKRLRELDPIHGLKDHTPGSVLTERERMGVSAKKARQLPVIEGESVWDVYRRSIGVPAVASLENQSVPIGETDDAELIDITAAVEHSNSPAPTISLNSATHVAAEDVCEPTNNTAGESTVYLDSIIANMITDRN